jgi:hypothetical protein
MKSTDLQKINARLAPQDSEANVPNKLFQFKISDLMIDGEQCQVLTCRDVTQVSENVRLTTENNMLGLINSSF